MTRLVAGLLFATASGVSAALFAAPQFKSQSEVIGGELRAKVLRYAEGVPPATPRARTYRITRGDESKEVKFYVPAELWRERAELGTWKDRKGNVMRLARVLSPVPVFEREDWYRDRIEKAMDESAAKWNPTEDDLNQWKKCWGGKGDGRFFTVKGRRYYIEFEFAETVRPADETRLYKTFLSSVSASVSGGANFSSSKWWNKENDDYRFVTDLTRSQGGAFIKKAMSQMTAMRRSYEKYVPPLRSVGQSKVRIFSTLKGYREYRASTGTDDKMSCGLWDPSREELLIAVEGDRNQAQNTMRHEAFHQYLHYATGRGDHAMWFNEGHATFFENVIYNPTRNSVRVVDSGDRAAQVAKDPEKYARAIRSTLKLDHAGYYSGAVNDHYVTGWAIIYFLEKGAYATEEFAAYRKIIPDYLKLMRDSTVTAAEATKRAWSVVADRDVAADFLKFWRKYRNAARHAR